MGLAEARDKVLSRPEAEIRAGTDKSKKDYTFFFRYETKRGKVYEGQFTNHILTNDQKWAMEGIVSRVFDCVPLNTISPVARYIAHCAVHLDMSLDKERPKWAENLGNLTDEDVVTMLYREVTTHEDIFFGREEDQGKSEGESEEQPD